MKSVPSTKALTISNPHPPSLLNPIYRSLSILHQHRWLNETIENTLLGIKLPQEKPIEGLRIKTG